jgi:hypothetical protein
MKKTQTVGRWAKSCSAVSALIGAIRHSSMRAPGWTAFGPFDQRVERSGHTAGEGLHRTVASIAHPAGQAEPTRFDSHGVTEADTLHATANGEMQGFDAGIIHGYLTRMPGAAPLSGDRMNSPGTSALSSDAASTMPSDMPNFILRGARLATITVRRPTSRAGS